MTWFRNSENKNGHAIKLLKEGVTKKYLITNKSDIKIGAMNIVSTNECRWVLLVKEIKDESYVIELLTMGNVIKETNNPMVKDVAGFNNMFKEIYNELVLEISHDGVLLAVKNPATIRSKWMTIRKEMKNLESQPSIGNVIKLNDDIFDNDENLFEVIKATELFELFFIGFYGKVLPGMRRVQRPNKFKGSRFDWNYEFTYAGTTDTVAPDTYEIKMNGFVNLHFSKQLVDEMYGKFDFLDYKGLKPVISCNGRYTLHKQTGMIEEAIYNNYEIIDGNQLYSKNEYTIASYA